MVMVDKDLFQQYSNSIKKFKKECIDAGLSEEEFKKLYYESLTSIEINEHTKIPRTQTSRFFRRFKLILGLLCIILITLWYHKLIYRSIVCNLQEYIYPGLRTLRKLSIPIISMFPALTDYYQETCLIQNPFFTVADMDCWPCSTISNIREVTDPKSVSAQQNAPFIYETDQQPINLETLKMMFMKNRNIFNKEVPKILVNNKYYIYPDDMFNKHINIEKNLYIWKFNNMNEAIILRQIIPRPKVVPKFGQSTERFLIIDSAQNAFKIPDTECSFSFILSLRGTRTIDLIPAEECKHQCKSLRVDLKETYLLWYNWWYWRPKIQPSSGNSTFIAHVGSYC